MSKSVDQVELAKSKIKSFEKNKNIDSLVSMIRDALSELSPLVKDETSFKSEREAYVHYILNCLTQFISEKQPNRDSLIRAFNLDGKKKGRPSKKVEGLEFSIEELKIFLDGAILKSIVPITNWIWTYYKRSKTMSTACTPKTKSS